KHHDHARSSSQAAVVPVAAAQTGKSFSRVGRCLRMGLLSKKFTGLRSKLDDTVGMMGKSSWHGTWWNPSVYHSTRSVFSIGRSLLAHVASVSSPLLW
uniref:Uncharacterized protein n=1 Tax=Oryza brachyantha TaxID=4533 RepID=J3LWC2_ORYBR